jgi:anti-sigma factor RsiW
MPDDVHELSALYALDVLDDDERASFERHLDECERCRAELDGLRDAAGSLAFAVEGPAPPDVLRSRILEAARAERPNVVPLRPRRSFAVSVAAAVAVAASAAAVALGVWAASLHRSLSHEHTTVSVLSDPRARHIQLRGARGQLVVAPSGQAVLAVDLPKLPKGKTYEAWVADPDVRRAGIFSGRTTTLRVPVRRGAQVLVSVERAGGTDAPTTTPIVSARA